MNKPFFPTTKLNFTFLFILLVCLFLKTTFLFSKNISIENDSTQQKIKSKREYSLLKKSVFPTILIVAGTSISESKFEKNIKTRLRNQVGNDYEFKIDDYLIYAPVVQLYLADALLGAKSKNHWFDQTKYLFMSNMLSSGVSYSIKKIVNKERPNGNNLSFPSGHTTVAFTNATVLKNEFKDSSVLLAYSGYAFAATAGTFRMINNKHWFSDVLAGAGIGILATEIIYHFEPLKNFNPFKKSNRKSKDISIVPQFGSGNYGVYCSYKF